VSGRCAAATLELAECRPVTHFDFDRATLQPGDLPRLQRLARCLSAEPSAQVTFEGNCDERGTTEYNLLLGDRRARAVESYGAGLGVEKGRLFAVSYGKERPLCLEHEESCWQQNRRTATMPGKPAEKPAPQAMR
jgi:peptidoglycan-associated lipoprotein